jgi:hypothetical protein
VSSSGYPGSKDKSLLLFVFGMGRHSSAMPRNAFQATPYTLEPPHTCRDATHSSFTLVIQSTLVIQITLVIHT